MRGGGIFVGLHPRPAADVIVIVTYSDFIYLYIIVVLYIIDICYIYIYHIGRTVVRGPVVL